jgi:hypothetical protein
MRSSNRFVSPPGRQLTRAGRRHDADRADLASPPAVPVAAAAAILRIETLAVEPCAKQFSMRRISKERILEALREGTNEQDAQTIARLKKPAMAAAAETALAGKGWLPALLQRPDKPAAYAPRLMPRIR